MKQFFEYFLVSSFAILIFIGLTWAINVNKNVQPKTSHSVAKALNIMRVEIDDLKEEIKELKELKTF